ncbi:MAG: right-handed parallel beta-helix repeat-containing protein [Chloroflexota bacterium]
MMMLRWIKSALAVGAAMTMALALLTLVGRLPVSAGAGETFIVNSTGDDPDSNIGNCSCATTGGSCTLRAAIQEANACSGAQTIRFNNPMTILPITALPALTGKGTVIDGSDQWVVQSGYEIPGVVLDGNLGNFSGLEITASDCAIYGIGITRFGRHGIHVYGGAQHNEIGGAGYHQRNVISDNGWNGVRIEGVTSIENSVVSNYIGTNRSGIAGFGNGWHGVSINYGGGNEITDNLIADNGWSGIAIDYAAKDNVENNRIGINVLGDPLGNGFYGIHIAHGATPMIIANTISYNKRGIYIEGNSNPWIYHNTISGHNASASSLNYAGYGGGIFCYQSAPVISKNIITDNIAYTGTDKTGYGGGIALYYCGGTLIGSNTVISNTANTTGYGEGGGISLRYSDDVLISSNTIMSNTAGADPDSRGGGLYLEYSNSGPRYHIVGNTIRGNSSAADGRGYGGGIHLFYSNALLDSNFILGNRATYGGGMNTQNSAFFTMMNNIISQNSLNGVHTWASSVTTGGMLYNNTIVQNGNSGVYLVQNSTLTLINNIIVSHTTGIYAIPGNGNTVVADYTLFYGNIIDTDGSLINSTNAITGRDPLFLSPASGNYHLRFGSPAVDAGMALCELTWDIDSDPRPLGANYDIGADEARFLLLPIILR